MAAFMAVARELGSASSSSLSRRGGLHVRSSLRSVHKATPRKAAIGAASLDSFDVDLRSPLGFGAHGAVYWAQNRMTGEEVAMKVVSAYSPGEGTAAELSNSIDMETRAYEELLASGDTHKSIVDTIAQFSGTGSEAGDLGIDLPNEAYEQPVHFFVTEFLDGGSLHDEIDRRMKFKQLFTESEVMTAALSVSEGLLFLHHLGIVHRDVKPENLLWPNARSRRDCGQLKLIDFSVAGVAPKEEYFDLDAAFDERLGTRGFVAPEVLQQANEAVEDAAKYGTSVDVFSLGCTLHAMLTGQPPEVEISKSDGAASVTCSLPKHISATTRKLIESMLAVESLDRPSVSDILEELTE